ncbi:GAF domain-containing protein [Variovorax sp. Varisp62]|uniref:GAF domain-containing protein n=1 Tax=Variovorax sp. Varisp62 TaxID=3243049 RepID=UPI0039B4D8B8
MSAQGQGNADDLHELDARLRTNPASALAVIDDYLRRYPGHRLFTVLAIDWTRHENRRIYSSNPDSYACGGSKPLVPGSAFHQEVILGNRARICPDRASCIQAFPDFDLIFSLHCESAINVPIRRSDRTIGSLNLLHKAHWYQPAMTALLTRVAGLAAPFLP